MLHYLQNLIQALDFSSMGDAALRVAAIFLCLTIHETCHGLAALALVCAGILVLNRAKSQNKRGTPI